MLAISRSGRPTEVVMRGKVKDFHAGFKQGVGLRKRESPFFDEVTR
jgi:hypothetical protein